MCQEVSKVSEPSRQQKWVTIKQEVTPGGLRWWGGLGQATFSCCFPSPTWQGQNSASALYFLELCWEF